ncbi:MAG: hypothetical protein LH470_00500 [Lysobacter sp.]|nr:hypothetical protein [Lysobacter sp.]
MRIALLLLGTTLFASCSCQRGSDDVQTMASPQDAVATQPAVATSDANPAAAAELARLRDARYAAYADAASAVQGYLSAIGAQDWKKANPYWSNQQPGSGEADLRSMKKLHALRIESDTPKALDQEPVPNALEVPVNLRASFQDGQPLRRYRGWYRLRRKVSGEGWEITSASIDAVPR